MEALNADVSDIYTNIENDSGEVYKECKFIKIIP